MKTKKDFLGLLNYTKGILLGDKAVPFELKHLNYHSNPKANPKRYVAFAVKKKAGGTRTIHSPAKGLKAIQKCLNLILQVVYANHQHKAANGFVPNKSIVDNARVHANSLYVYNLDLKDFFPSIDQARVWGRLKFPPFNLNEKTGRLDLAGIIASLCCHSMEVERLDDAGNWKKEIRNVLPQGAPTSPTITNIICQQLDFYLTAVARRFQLKYSRYADDITFSSQHNVYHKDGEFLQELHRLIAAQNFHIKESKTRLQKQGYRQEVTGLVVNEEPNVPKRYIKQLRMWLYYWEQYGYDRAYSYFMQQYKADKGHLIKGKPDMANVIKGKLDYLKMVKGTESTGYQKLAERYILLTKQEPVAEEFTVSNDISGMSELVSSVIKVTLENSGLPSNPNKLIKAINIPKDTILPSVLLIDNKITTESTSSNKLFPHNPLHTVSFLKKFKIADGSGFKELVHDIILSDEVVKDIITKVKSHPNFIYHYKKERVLSIDYLNIGIRGEVIQLIDLFESEGIPFYKETGKHPFNNDEVYTVFAKEFKKKYRYGSGSEYSKLQQDILSIASDQKIALDCIEFLPDERAFNIRSGFFTWQPLIYKGLRHIFQGIADHSNINGEDIKCINGREVQVRAEKGEANFCKFIEISILDKNSKAKIESDLLLHYYKESTAFKQDFRNLCDWIIECDFTVEPSKRINLLTASHFNYNIDEIEPLDHLVGGFKHILRFYDIR
ncbi:reverse transcriptase family protein [Rufibacter roseus]|uniref:RNA-directed DNA polymerase n=2 Tax=Rufibacter roseus TaxID=1567108 RepID=A0ABW2DP62_9BACT